MKVVEWTDELSVGVASLDTHHQTLIDLLNQLHQVIRNNDTQQVVGEVLGELIRYTYYHFGEEERLLEQAGYDDLDAHRQSHRSIAERVRDMEAEWETDHRSVIAAELFEFLADWLIHHIRNEDMRYRSVLSEF